MRDPILRQQFSENLNQSEGGFSNGPGNGGLAQITAARVETILGGAEINRLQLPIKVKREQWLEKGKI